VVEGEAQLRLADEALRDLAARDLEGDDVPVLAVPRAVDDRLTAGADRRLDLVRTDDRPARERARGRRRDEREPGGGGFADDVARPRAQRLGKRVVLARGEEPLGDPRPERTLGHLLLLLLDLVVLVLVLVFAFAHVF
jgi:hypothetical protein